MLGSTPSKYGTPYTPPHHNPVTSGGGFTTPGDQTAVAGATPPSFGNWWQQALGSMGPTLAQGQGTMAGAQQAAGFQNALDFYTAMYGPQFLLNEQQRAALTGQIGSVQANQSLQESLLQQQYQQSLSSNQSALGYNAQLQDIAKQLLGVGTESAKAQADISSRQAKSSATARGAWNAPGLGQTLHDISGDLSRTLEGLDLGHQKEMAGLEEQAKQLGISSAQLGTQLQQGLARLGLDTMLTVSDLQSKLTSSSVQDQMLAQQIYNEALANSDYFAQYAYTPTPPTGGYGTGGKFYS